MVVLSDRDIKQAIRDGKINITGIDINSITVASVDLRLGNKFRIFKNSKITHIDTKEGIIDGMMDLVEVAEGEAFVVHPGEFVLGITHEYIKLPDDLVGRLDGRSSLGRLGIVVHSTAGSIDPGFEGNITLEISNLAKVPVKLWPGSRVCRITFDKLSSPSETPYNKRKNSKYIKPTTPEASKIRLDN